MPVTTTSERYDELWSLTARAVRKRISDIIFDEEPTLKWFHANAEEVEAGGKEIGEYIEYDKQPTEWYGMYQELQTSRRNALTMAFYPWRFQAVPVSIDEQEEAMTEQRRSCAQARQFQTSERHVQYRRCYLRFSLWSAERYQDAWTPGPHCRRSINRIARQDPPYRDQVAEPGRLRHFEFRRFRLCYAEVCRCHSHEHHLQQSLFW